jgi:hypothetical protein
MSPWLVAVTGLIYSYIAVDQFFKGAGAMCIVYAGYAFSNLGLYFVVKGN